MGGLHRKLIWQQDNQTGLTGGENTCVLVLKKVKVEMKMLNGFETGGWWQTKVGRSYVSLKDAGEVNIVMLSAHSLRSHDPVTSASPARGLGEVGGGSWDDDRLL